MHVPTFQTGGQLVVRIYQVIDVANAESMTDILLGLVRDCDEESLVLDLRSPLLTSTGVEVLARVQEAAEERGLRWRLVIRRPLARHVLRILAPECPSTTEVPVSTAPAAGRPSRQRAGLVEEMAGMRLAMRFDPVVDMARGVLMAVATCSATEAGHLVDQVARSTGIDLHDVAHHIVGGVNGPPPPPAVRDALAEALARRTGGKVEQLGLRGREFAP